MAQISIEELYRGEGGGEKYGIMYNKLRKLKKT